MKPITHKLVKDSFFQAIFRNQSLENVLNLTFEIMDSGRDFHNPYTTEEKYIILESLLESGADTLREFKSQVGPHLQIARVTVYNYVNKIYERETCQLNYSSSNEQIMTGS